MTPFFRWRKPRPMKCLHISGPPRSGTTLMLEMMLTCFQIDHFDRKETSILSMEKVKSRKGGILCTKNPSEWSILSRVLEADPNQWIIYMMRDPRDMVVSKHRLHPEVYWSNLRLFKQAWAATQSSHSDPRFIVVRYEDLVREPDATQDMLMKRMPFLQAKCRFSNYHQKSKPSKQSVRAMHGLRPISDASIGSWRSHKPRVLGQLQIHGSINDILKAMNYETDDAWLEELKDTTPDLTPSHLSDDVDSSKEQAHTAKKRSLCEAYLKNRGLE